LDLTRLHSVTH